MELLSFENLAAFFTLAALEIVLGIDNIVFLAILSGRVEPAKRAQARQLGLLGAMVMRIALLLSLNWVAHLEIKLFAVMGVEISARDLVMLAGGLFLIYKAVHEIHAKLEGGGHGPEGGGQPKSFWSVIAQIMAIDLVFSLDSVIVAIGMAQKVEIMVAAVVAAVIVMMVFAGPVSRFVEHHPTMKMLALAFLLMIGALLVAEGLHQHFDRKYVYFAMAFSFVVELLNLRVRKVNAKSRA